MPDGIAEKSELQERLDAVKDGLLEAQQQQIIANAEKYIRYAEQIGSQSYINKAQEYIDQILDEEKRQELQERLDAVKNK